MHHHDTIFLGEFMKIKYLRLNRNEKKAVKEKFYQTSIGKYIKKKLRSALICALLCIIFAIYLIIDAFVNDLTIVDKFYGFAILTIGVAFLIIHRKIFIKKINEYVIKNK